MIYFLHIDLPKIIREALRKDHSTLNKLSSSFYNYFNEVKKIHKVIDNMKIYLKYHKEESEY